KKAVYVIITPNGYKYLDELSGFYQTFAEQFNSRRPNIKLDSATRVLSAFATVIDKMQAPKKAQKSKEMARHSGTEMRSLAMLHSGTEKTGTTSIQAAGDANRDALLNFGVLYPKNPGKSNHVGLAIACLKPGWSMDLRRQARLLRPAEYSKFASNFWSDFERE